MEIRTNPIIALASNPNTSPETLAKLVTHPDPDVRYLTLINPSLPYKTMQDVAYENNTEYTFIIVENPSLPDNLLIEIASKSEVEDGIHLQIIGRKNVSLNVLEQIWCNTMFTHPSTMYALFEKTNLPVNIIEEVYDNNVYSIIPEILNKLAEYPNTPKHIINNIITKTNMEAALQTPLTFPSNFKTQTSMPSITTIRKEHSRIVNLNIITALAKNLHTEAETLTIISESKDSLVRYHIAKHPNTPKEVLFNLLLDPEIKVRTEAYYNPNCEEEYRQTVLFTGGINKDENREHLYQTFNKGDK